MIVKNIFVELILTLMNELTLNIHLNIIAQFLMFVKPLEQKLHFLKK